MATAVENLVRQLRAAAAAYYNGGSSCMDDDTYDAAVERLRELDSTHPFLQEVGAPVPSSIGATQLPYPMPSLDKIKPGEDRLDRFLCGVGPGGFVLSEKLDGLSALYVPSTKKVYLRGDGLFGQDITEQAKRGIRGLQPVAGCGNGGGTAIRGELVLPRTAGESLARSWVNGILHRKDASPADLGKIRFVAYELISPSPLKREAQFHWLKEAGFELPWWTVVPTLKEEQLATALKARRAESPYDTDGIVVAYNQPPKSECTADRCRNPKDAVAFKMPLADQSAETTVKAVHWGASAQGYLIPKLEFDPVVIGAATIQFCTAHNAKTVSEMGLGPGARIIVRRSGDVIPKLDTVIVPAAVCGPFPPEGSYEWDATRTHIRVLANASAASAVAQTDIIVARLGHFLKGLELPGVGPATAGALVEAGIKGPRDLWNAASEKLQDILGPKTGAALWTNYRERLEKVTEKGLMLASSQMPRGVGETKLSALFAAGGDDPRGWRGETLRGATVPGWTAASLESFWSSLEGYETWRKAELGGIVPYPKEKGMGGQGRGGQDRGGQDRGGQGTAAQDTPAGILCMTGFRDRDLEAKATARGFTVAPTFTSKVTHLLVADGTIKESEKTKAARARGIPILSRSVFIAEYNL